VSGQRDPRFAPGIESEQKRYFAAGDTAESEINCGGNCPWPVGYMIRDNQRALPSRWLCDKYCGVPAMNLLWAKLIFFAGVAVSSQAQTGSNPPSNNTISPPPRSLDRPPSPPDAPLPDLDSVPSPAAPTKSKAKRALDRLAPNCVDVVYHSCWSSPTGDPSRLPEAARGAQRNREAGEIYYSNKNYKGSESRFREALRYEPADPVATFELAESLDKLGRRAEARDFYQIYLSILPDDPSATRAKKALKRLPSPSSSAR
jgi:tetratricopeptide (TPR) repeat protein